MRWKALSKHFPEHSMHQNTKTHSSCVICKNNFRHFLLPANTPTSLFRYFTTPAGKEFNALKKKTDFKLLSKKLTDIHINQPNWSDHKTYILSTQAPFKYWQIASRDRRKSALPLPLALQVRTCTAGTALLTNIPDQWLGWKKPKTLNPNISAPNYWKTFLKKAFSSSRQGLFKNMSEIPVRHLGAKLWSSSRRISIAIFLLNMGWINFLKKAFSSSSQGLSKTFHPDFTWNAR